MMMREKMARAILDYRQSRGYSGQASWSYEPDEIRELYLATADAVLDALMEPTEAMLRAGFEDYPTIWTAGVTPEDRIGIWQAMIAAAKEG